MAFLYPWSLAALAAVAAVAIWAWFRPGSQLVIVPSLWLWRQAAETAHRDSRRSRRRVSPSWLLLLIGAVAAALAGARPVIRTQAPVRRIALVLHPSAEIASADGMADLRLAAGELLRRLDARDRVQLLLPVAAEAGPAGRWLSPAEARAAVERIEPLPLPVASLNFPPVDDRADHIYRVGVLPEPASGGRTTTIALAPRLGPASLEVAAARAADDEPGPVQQVELLVAVRNHLRQNWTGRVVVSAAAVGADGKVTLRRLWEEPMTIAPLGLSQALVSRGAEAAFVVELEDGGPAGVARQAYLARRQRRPLKVALAGRDEPLLRKFVRAHEGLEPAGDPKEADVVIVNGEPPPADRPALVINPPRPPAGWQADPVANLALAQADVERGDALLRGVDLAGVAVRQAQAWTATDLASQKPVVSLTGKALVLREEPRGTDAGPRRVWVGFDLSADNTNLALSRSFPILLANAVEALAGERTVREAYESLPPGRAEPAWRSVLAGSGDQPPWPGLYRDAAGDLRAVSVAGLIAPGEPLDRDAQEQARLAPLPPSRPAGRQMELWWVLAAAAMAAWLAGWALRVR